MRGDWKRVVTIPRLSSTLRLPLSKIFFANSGIFLLPSISSAAGENEGTDQEISAETGIPTGQSSGKASAMLDYCRGMGLIHD